MIDDIVHAAAECGGNACSVQGAALLLHAVSAWRIWPQNENVVNMLFSMNQVCTQGVGGQGASPTIRGVQFTLFFVQSFLTQEELVLP